MATKNLSLLIEQRLSGDERENFRDLYDWLVATPGVRGVPGSVPNEPSLSARVKGPKSEARPFNIGRHAVAGDYQQSLELQVVISSIRNAGFSEIAISGFRNYVEDAGLHIDGESGRIPLRAVSLILREELKSAMVFLSQRRYE